MNHPFTTLAGEYTALLSAMSITASAERELDKRTPVILALAAKEGWTAVTSATGVPRLWAMASFERESSSDYRCSPAQGDRWDKVSTHVPRGLGAYKCWADSAIAAYRIDHLDTVGAPNWIWARSCFEGELFNGFGPRNHGRHTGYLWAGTNIYTGGKYVADGVWDPNAFDTQLGMIPLMVAMQRLDPSLELADALPGITAAPVPQPQPVPAGLGTGPNAQWVQERLNALGADPVLVVDGNYGRRTRAAVALFQGAQGLDPDGIFGPLTRKAMTG